MAERAAGRLSLLHILALYAAYNPKVGYCQGKLSETIEYHYYTALHYAGMAYVGGLLLMSMEEEDAFWAMMSLFESPKYLAGYYDATMSRYTVRQALWSILVYCCCD